jgi:hypothetical protein
MNAIYFAIGCLLIVAVIFWGSLEPEPKKLAALFERRPLKDSDLKKPPKKKVRW